MKRYRVIFRKVEMFPLWCYTPGTYDAAKVVEVALKLRELGYEVEMKHDRDAVKFCRSQEKVKVPFDVEAHKPTAKRVAGGQPGQRYSPRIEPVSIRDV